MDEKTLCTMRRKYTGLSDIELENIHLYKRMMKDKATLLELVHLSYLRGMITAEDYAQYLEIERMLGEE